MSPAGDMLATTVGPVSASVISPGTSTPSMPPHPAVVKRAAAIRTRYEARIVIMILRGAPVQARCHAPNTAIPLRTANSGELVGRTAQTDWLGYLRTMAAIATRQKQFNGTATIRARR